MAYYSALPGETFSFYAPTMNYSDKIKAEFYSELDIKLKSTSTHDKRLRLCDFKERLGSNSSV